MRERLSCDPLPPVDRRPFHAPPPPPIVSHFLYLNDHHVAHCRRRVRRPRGRRLALGRDLGPLARADLEDVDVRGRAGEADACGGEEEESARLERDERRERQEAHSRARHAHIARPALSHTYRSQPHPQDRARRAGPRPGGPSIPARSRRLERGGGEVRVGEKTNDNDARRPGPTNQAPCIAAARCDASTMLGVGVGVRRGGQCHGKTSLQAIGQRVASTSHLLFRHAPPAHPCACAPKHCPKPRQLTKHDQPR